MAPRATNVGAIEVALGVNLTQLNKDLGGQGIVSQLRAGAGAPIVVPLSAEADVASARTARAKIEEIVAKPIVVHARVEYDEEEAALRGRPGSRGGGEPAAAAGHGKATGGERQATQAQQEAANATKQAAKDTEAAARAMVSASKAATDATAQTRREASHAPRAGRAGGTGTRGVAGATTGATSEATQVQKDIQTISGGTMTAGVTRQVLSRAAKSITRPVEAARETERDLRHAASTPAAAPARPLPTWITRGEAQGAGSSYLGTSQEEMRRAQADFESLRNAQRDETMRVIGPLGFTDPTELKGVRFDFAKGRLVAPKGKGREWQGRMRGLNRIISPNAAARAAAPTTPANVEPGLVGPWMLGAERPAEVIDTHARGVRGARLAFGRGTQKPEDATFVEARNRSFRESLKGLTLDQWWQQQQKAEAAPPSAGVKSLMSAYGMGNLAITSLARGKGLTREEREQLAGAVPVAISEATKAIEAGNPAGAMEPLFAARRGLRRMRPKWFSKATRNIRRSDKVPSLYTETDPGWVSSMQAAAALRSRIYAAANVESEDQATRELGERTGANTRWRKAQPAIEPERSERDRLAARAYANLNEGIQHPRVEPAKVSPIKQVGPTTPGHVTLAGRSAYEEGVRAGRFTMPEGSAEPRAAGGSVEGPLARRLREARQKREGTYLVGEKRPELYVSPHHAEIVGQNGPEVRQFPEAGEIKPFVPAWVQRMAKNAKDFTPRFEGGPVEGTPTSAERERRRRQRREADAMLERGGYSRGEAGWVRDPQPSGAPKEEVARPTADGTTPGENDAAFEQWKHQKARSNRADAAARKNERYWQEWDRERKTKESEGYIWDEGWIPGPALQAKRDRSNRARMQPRVGSRWVKAEATPVAAPVATDRGAPGVAAPQAAAPRIDPRLGQDAQSQIRQMLASQQAQRVKELGLESIPGGLAPLTPKEEADRIVARSVRRMARLEESTGFSTRGTTALQSVPPRNPTLAVTQIAEQEMGGRRKAVEMQKELGVQMQRLKTFKTEHAKYQEVAEDTARAISQEMEKEEPNDERLTRLARAYHVATEASKQFGDMVEVQQKHTEAAAAAVEDAANPLRALTVGFASNIAILTGWGAAMHTVGTAMSGVTRVVGPLVERTSGFRETAGKELGTLADLTTQSKGYVSVALATAEAQAGMADSTAKLTTAQLAGATTATAGSKALSDQLQIMHTVMALQGQGQPSWSAGLLQPSGGYMGLTRSTGGLLGSPIGAQPSIIEQMLGELPPSGVPTAATSTLQGIGKIPEQIPIFSNVMGFFKGLNGAPNRGTPGNVTQDVLNKTNAYLKLYNDQVVKGGSSLKLLTVAAGASGDALLKASDKSLVLAGLTQDQIDKLDQNRIALVAPNNKPVSSRGGVDYLNAYATGSLQQTVSEALTQLGPQIAAARAGTITQAGLQMQSVLPAQFALQQQAQPLTPISAGYAPTKWDVQGTKQGFAEIKTAADDLDAKIKRMAQEGQAALEALVPSELQGQFNTVSDAITQVSSQIQSVQTRITMRSAALEASQYANEMRLATRSLTDAEQLTGKLGASTGDNLGLLQRENILLDRQAQTYSLMLQQRQITTQLAVAQFQAPGETPEERYARKQEQITEATIAQKQLNIQKQQFTVGVKIVDIGNLRQLTDVINQVKLLQQGRQVQVLNTADTAQLDRLNRVMAQEQAKMQAMVNAGTQLQQQAVSTTQQVAIETGKAFGVVEAATFKAWGVFATAAEAAIQALTLTGSTPQGGKGQRHQASGFVGSFSRPTSFTVGEAQGETVAVLRNVRQGMLSGGSGASPTQVTINITGTSVRSDADISALAARVAEEVEMRIGRKAQLSGLRFPSY